MESEVRIGMKLGIFADVHNNEEALSRVLADAAAQAVDELIFLGDVDRSLSVLEMITQHAAVCIFGNWEVSWIMQSTDSRVAQIAAWPVKVRRGQAIFAHATPDMPAAVQTTADAAALRAAGGTWMRLFPHLDRHEGAMWSALAVLEAENARVAFHGHTHRQQVQVWTADAHGRRCLRTVSTADRFELTPGPAHQPSRYLIGVGSVGKPDEDARPRYAIYDEEAEYVQLRVV